jgi:hypothetical protein
MICGKCKSYIQLEVDKDGFCGKHDKFLPPSSEACPDYVVKQTKPVLDKRKLVPE